MKEYGLVGFPLSHSFSKEIFEEIFLAHQVHDARYHLFPLDDITGLTSLISANNNLEGLNVTIPYKEQIIPFLNRMDKTSLEIGAVNCVKIGRGSGKVILKGYNTDVAAFCQTLKPRLRPNHDHALVIGAGGAAKAVCHCLKSLGISYTVASRTPGKDQIDYKDLGDAGIASFPLIVNATPVGMYPKSDDFPGLPYDRMGPSHLLYDLVYNPLMTAFLKKGSANGASVLNGFEMLKLQAELSWRIWSDPAEPGS